MPKDSNITNKWADFTEFLLENEKSISMRAKGFSMYPTLKTGDKCLLEKCHLNELRKGDIIACRNNQNFILHRLVALNHVNGKQWLIMRGDNMPKADAPFEEEQFVARLVSFERNGKTYKVSSPMMKWRKLTDKLFHPINSRVNRILLSFSSVLNFSIRSIRSIRSNINALLQNSKRIFTINAIVSIFKGIIPLALIVTIKYLVDFIGTASSHSTIGLYLLLGIVASLFLFSGLLQGFGRFWSEKLSQSVSRKVYNDLHQKHTLLHLSDFEDTDQLDKMHRAVQEASYRPVRMLNSSLGFLKTSISGILLMGVFLSIHWSLLLVLVIAVMPEGFFRVLYVRRLHRLKANQISKEREKHYYNRVITAYPFAKEIRLFDFSSYFIRLFNRKQDELFNDQTELTRYELRNTIITQSFATLLIFLSLVIVTYSSTTGNMPIGNLVLFLLAFQRGYSLLNEFFSSIAGLIEDNTFLEDFLSFLQLPDSTEDEQAATEPFRLKQDIRLSNLFFSYKHSDRETLKDINIHIPAGKTIALVGENGAGKTTLIKLLCGFFKPDSGKILIDGVELQRIGQKQVLSNITAVFQDFALYQVSAMDNILLGNYHRKPNVEDAISAARAAGIDQTLDKLPFGYQTRLGHLFKESEELSIGQWQKIALARAFYREKPILLMDEPSSALDANSERQMINSLKNLSKNKTTIIVSHRLSTVQWADCIYLLDKGEIAESGTHDELMQLEGKYFSLYNSTRKI